MADEREEQESDEEPSFKERLEQARERQEAEGGDPMAEMGPGGMGGGNPFAQMMGGMLGGGGPGGQMQQEARDTAVARELAELREDIKEMTTQLERIADNLEE